MKWLQKLGKALMLPVACLPICGILMGIGYLLCPSTMQGGDVVGFAETLGFFLVKAGAALIDNIAILFVIGVGVGMSDKNDGTGGLAALASWLMMTTLLSTGVVTTIMPSMAEKVVSEVKKYCKKPLIVKLTPNVTDITEIAKAVEAEGADSVSLINTMLGMAIDAEKRKPILSTITGGLSGPCVKPVALRMVWQTYHAVKIPIIGLGGISNWKDAVEFMLAGASAIQIGTYNFVDPTVSIKVIDGLNDYCDRHGFKSVKELIGALDIQR